MPRKKKIFIISRLVSLFCLFILILFPSSSRSEGILVATGDSITAGYPFYSSECYVPKLALLSGIYTYNLGVGGALSRDGRSSIDNILNVYNPKILTIFFGTNDAHETEVEVLDVYYNLQYMVRSCKNRGTKPILATIGPQCGTYYQYRSRIDTINTYIRSLASQEGIPLADIATALGWNCGYLYDEFHPNLAAHSIMANTFYQAMIAGCTYTIDPASVLYPASGGEGSIAVGIVAGTACPWKAVSNVDWISVTAGNSEVGDGMVDYLVYANKTNQYRTGTITVAGKTFTVTQKRMAGLPWLQLLLEE